MRNLPDRLTLELPPTLQEISAGIGTLATFFSECYQEAHVCTMLELAASEILTNIVRHGMPSHSIRLSAVCTRRAVTLTVTDHAPPFDMTRSRPSSAPDPLAESGRGLWLIQNTMDRFRYRYRRGLNVHRVVKQFEPSNAMAD